MDSGLEALLLRGQRQQGQEGSSVLSAPEAERLIERLEAFTVEDVGSAKWQAQHDALSQLNLQAHYNARHHTDEFVVDLLVSLDRVKVVIHDLLVIEAWRANVLPHLQRHLSEHMDPLSSYMLLYQECAVANFLEVTLFHAQTVESTPEDYLLELADWAYRKLTYLNSKEAAAFAEPKERTAKEMLAMTPLQELQQRLEELDFASAMSALSIVRYLTDSLGSAPISLLSRIVSTNDTVMALLPLLERPPWVRRRKGKLERWEASGMHWTQVDAADRLRLGQFEIQVWLAINNLVVEPKARAKYSLDEYRKEKLMGLKRHLNELLFDQLPVLKDLQRVLDEMGLGMGAADREASKQAGLILEQVPMIRESLVKGRDWRVVALKQAQTHFAKDRTVDKARVEAISKMLDQMCELEVPADATASSQGDADGKGDGGAAALPGPVSVECRRKVHDSGVWEPFCQFELSPDPSRSPDPVEVAGPQSGSTARSGQAVHGLRYRLQPMDPTSSTPLPSNGKILFKVPLPGGALVLAEALLQLPDAPLKEAVADLPPVVWVTAGLLATDGAALQLKLQRAAKPQHRDKLSGVWYAYHPCGGALTIRRENPDAALQPVTNGINAAARNGAAAGVTSSGNKITALPAKQAAQTPKQSPKPATSVAVSGSPAVAAASGAGVNAGAAALVSGSQLPTAAGTTPTAEPATTATATRLHSAASTGPATPGATAPAASGAMARAAPDVTSRAEEETAAVSSTLTEDDLNLPD